MNYLRPEKSNSRRFGAGLKRFAQGGALFASGWVDVLTQALLARCKSTFTTLTILDRIQNIPFKGNVSGYTAAFRFLFYQLKLGQNILFRLAQQFYLGPFVPKP